MSVIYLAWGIIVQEGGSIKSFKRVNQPVVRNFSISLFGLAVRQLTFLKRKFPDDLVIDVIDLVGNLGI